MFRVLLTAMLLLTYTAELPAELLSDPMRPYTAPVVSKTPRQIRYDLSAILYSPQRRVAIVNGVSVGEGDKVSGAYVRRINRRSLELEVNGQLLKLVLGNVPETKSNRSLQ